MGSTFYLFYMVLFTGGLLWCLFLWLVRDEEEEQEDSAASHDSGPPDDLPSPASPPRPAPSRAGYGDTSFPPGEAK